MGDPISSDTAINHVPNLKLVGARSLLDILTDNNSGRHHMDTAPHDLIAAIAGQAAEAVSRRAGESPQCRDDRTRAAMDALQAFAPGDAVEAMLASHCLMLHELIVAEVNNALSDEDPVARRATRNSVVAMDKAFGNNLIRLQQYRAARQSDLAPGEDCAEPELADRMCRQPQQNTPGAEQSDDTSTQTWPSLNRQARRALDRQTRKRSMGLAIPDVTPDRNAPAATAFATTAG